MLSSRFSESTCPNWIWPSHQNLVLSGVFRVLVVGHTFLFLQTTNLRDILNLPLFLTRDALFIGNTIVFLHYFSSGLSQCFLNQNPHSEISVEWREILCKGWISCACHLFPYPRCQDKPKSLLSPGCMWISLANTPLHSNSLLFSERSTVYSAGFFPLPALSFSSTSFYFKSAQIQSCQWDLFYRFHSALQTSSEPFSLFSMLPFTFNYFMQLAYSLWPLSILPFLKLKHCFPSSRGLSLFVHEHLVIYNGAWLKQIFNASIEGIKNNCHERALQWALKRRIL